jgi:hypothetical protein
MTLKKREKAACLAASSQVYIKPNYTREPDMGQWADVASFWQTEPILKCRPQLGEGRVKAPAQAHRCRQAKVNAG